MEDLQACLVSIDAFRAENPLSSAFERMTGAAGPLFDKIPDI